jgi:lysozyme
VNLEKLIRDLKQDEGLRLKPYFDTVGVKTIGYGRNMSAKPLSDHTNYTLKKFGAITESQAEEMLREDIQGALIDAQMQPWWPMVRFDEVRANVMLNLLFNLGLTRLNGFRKMLNAIQRKDWKTAAAEGRDSRWFVQVKGRGQRLMNQLETGHE